MSAVGGPWPWVRRAVTAIAVVATVVVLVAQADDVTDALANLSPLAFVGLVGLQAVYLLPQAYRYWLVLDHAGEGAVPFLPWLRVFVVGRMLNIAVSQGGNVYRAVELKSRFGLTYGDYTAAFVAFTWLATLLNFGLAAVVVAATDPGLRIAAVPALPAVVLAGVGLLAIPIAVARLMPEGADSASSWSRVVALSGRVVRKSVSVLEHRGLVARFLGVGLVGFVLAVAIFRVLFAAIGEDVGLATTVLFYVLVQLTTYLVITPGNVGIQELGFAGLAEATGIGSGPGIVAAALLRFTGIVGVLVAATFLGGWRTWRQWRRQRLTV